MSKCRRPPIEDAGILPPWRVGNRPIDTAKWGRLKCATFIFTVGLPLARDGFLDVSWSMKENWLDSDSQVVTYYQLYLKRSVSVLAGGIVYRASGRRSTSGLWPVVMFDHTKYNRKRQKYDICLELKPTKIQPPTSRSLKPANWLLLVIFVLMCFGQLLLSYPSACCIFLW